MEGNSPQSPESSVTQQIRPEVKDVSQEPTTDPQQSPESPTSIKPKKRIILTILVILIIFVSLGVGAYFILKNASDPKTLKTENKETGEEMYFYKGVWMPSLGASMIPESLLPEGLIPEGYDISIMEPVFADLDKAVEAGINTLAFQMGYWVDDNGELSLLPGTEEFFTSYIDEAHARGIKVWLNPEIIYSREGVGTSGMRIMPEELIVKTNLLKNFELAIVETAKFAEEHDVEIFSPSSEMYASLDFDTPGRPRSLKLIAEIKPKIDTVYNGKICLRGEWPRPEFSEYSCFAPTIGAPRNEAEKKKLLDNIDFQNRREDMKVELIIGEIWEGNDWQGTPEDAKNNIETVLEIVEGKVNGFFILDIGSISPRFPGSFEGMIKEFYTEY